MGSASCSALVDTAVIHRLVEDGFGWTRTREETIKPRAGSRDQATESHPRLPR